MTHNTTVPKRTLSTFHDMMCETEIAIDELQLLPTTARAGGRGGLLHFDRHELDAWSDQQRSDQLG